MSAQETYDRVCRHLLAQGMQAKDPMTGSCVLRADDGCMCAVGCLISAGDYRPEMETAFFGNLVRSGLLATVPIGAYDSLDSDHYSTLTDLQEVHDSDSNWRTPATLADAMRLVAVRHKLDPSVLSTAPFADPWPANGLSYR